MLTEEKTTTDNIMRSRSKQGGGTFLLRYMVKIAIQGIEGSFHDMAAHQYFPGEDVRLVCCDTFEGIFEEMRKDSDCLGLMAIENTIAGSLLPNYELLRAGGATVVGEHKLHIAHSLLCLPEDDMESVTEVNSHPVALAQCRAFLAGHPSMRAVEAGDTAGAAADIARKGLRGHAAICNAAAAPLYGLKVLEEGIEDNKHNYTRFLLLSAPQYAGRYRTEESTDKSSLVFSLPHEEGALSQVLSVFSFYKANLTKIQSLPVIGHEWEYLFYVDVVYSDYTRYRQCIDAVRPLTKALRELGVYKGK